MEKLEYWSASEIGRAVNSGKFKPSEVLSYFYERIQKRNPVVNAFVYTEFAKALKVAKKQDEILASGKTLGPFAGVPFGLKDFLPNKPGWASTHGGVKCLRSIDEEYSPFCFAMEEAGGIALGKTNAPAYGFRGTTDNYMYGPTSTPFNLAYNAGGSSGGSAAAVAAGLIPISEGGDAGGSIRVPASFCGVFGFKAGVGVIPMINRPDAFSAMHPVCTGGGLTKSVEDAAILLNYSAHYDPRDPFSKPGQIDYAKESHRDVDGMKIAYTCDYDIFLVDEKVREKFKERIALLKQAGYSLEEVHFKFKHSLKQMSDAWCKGITIDPAIGLNLLKQQGNDLLKDHLEDFPSEFVYWKKQCDQLNIMDLYDFNLVRSDILDGLEDVFENYDLILSPTCCVPYIENRLDGNTKGPEQINGKPVDSLIGWAETFLANFVGNPAASIPAGQFENGVPFGLHILGKRYGEVDVLSFARAYEVDFPWRESYHQSMEDQQ